MHRIATPQLHAQRSYRTGIGTAWSTMRSGLDAAMLGQAPLQFDRDIWQYMYISGRMKLDT